MQTVSVRIQGLSDFTQFDRFIANLSGKPVGAVAFKDKVIKGYYAPPHKKFYSHTNLGGFKTFMEEMKAFGFCPVKLEELKARVLKVNGEFRKHPKNSELTHGPLSIAFDF